MGMTIAIKDFGMPSCCMNCEMFDGEYGNCDIIGDTQDFEYQWDENRPFDCPLVEAIPKADYENRLKADLVAILTDIQLEIEEIKPLEPTDDEDWQCGCFHGLELMQDKCLKLIQQKINSLEEA